MRPAKHALIVCGVLVAVMMASPTGIYVERHHTPEELNAESELNAQSDASEISEMAVPLSQKGDRQTPAQALRKCARHDELLTSLKGRDEDLGSKCKEGSDNDDEYKTCEEDCELFSGPGVPHWGCTLGCFIDWCT